MSPAEAVLRYASDFIPSWAGAISIDLMPAVLVLILCVVHAAIRREGIPAISASNMTVGELVAAIKMAREVQEVQRNPPGPARVDPGPSPAPAVVTDENVTALASARHGK
jgi:hypothetical protein